MLCVSYLKEELGYSVRRALEVCFADRFMCMYKTHTQTLYKHTHIHVIYIDACTHIRIINAFASWLTHTHTHTGICGSEAPWDKASKFCR